MEKKKYQIGRANEIVFKPVHVLRKNLHIIQK